MTRLQQIQAALLRSPILWGLLASLAFYLPIEAGYVTHPALLRYFAGHWVEYIEVIMFFIGLAALVIMAIDVRAQKADVQRPLLPATPLGGQPVEDCPALLARLTDAAKAARPGYLIRRMRDALEHVCRKGSAASLDGEIARLSDLDAVRAQHGYAFVRIIIWAIPILGFMGTVIGITMAIANLAPQALEASLPEVTFGLGVAFDTTAIALGLSMVLMFTQFAIDRAENRLLDQVDARVSAELVGRFREDTSEGEPQLAALRRMLEAVVQSTDGLVARQSELWQGTIQTAQDRWQQASATAGKQVETGLAVALERGLKVHAEQLAATEKGMAEQNRQHWAQVQQALVQSSEASVAQQKELRKQGEILLRVVEATRQIGELEHTLNRNLQQLASAKAFEDMVLSLTAAIHLLSGARLAPSDAQPVELTTRRTGQAA